MPSYVVFNALGGERTDHLQLRVETPPFDELINRLNSGRLVVVTSNDDKSYALNPATVAYVVDEPERPRSASFR